MFVIKRNNWYKFVSSSIKRLKGDITFIKIIKIIYRIILHYDIICLNVM